MQAERMRIMPLFGKRTIWLCFLATIIFFSGGAQAAGSKVDRPLIQKVTSIISYVEYDQWTLANQEVAKLRGMYKKEKWKLQLLGDEEEYEGLDRELDHLASAALDQDKTEAKKSLVHIRAILKAIYSM
jgi:hypothetical protein